MTRQIVLSLSKNIRDRWHPLFHLRRSRLFRSVLERANFPIWVRLYNIPHPVRIYSARHASYLLNRRTIEPEIVALFGVIHAVYAPRTFWDIGAYIGYYSWLLKGMDTGIEVTMFEPDIVNRRVIEETLTRSGLTGVRIIPAAVSESDGEKTFSLDCLTGATGTLEDPNSSFVKRHYDLDPALVNVNTVTIDSVRRSGKPVDMIKIDVEGHEAQVFAGAEHTLAEDQPILVFECFHHDQAILGGLTRKGYQLYDAERMSANCEQATNYLAIPTRHAALTEQLFEVWRVKNAAVWKS